jgi:ketosteroid isomerase-like protein
MVGVNSMTRKLGYLLLLALGSILAMAQEKDPREGKLVILERLWNEAQVDHDTAALDQLLSSRFVNTEYNGEVSDKRAFLADTKEPLFKPASSNIYDLKVSFFGDTAIVTGGYHTQGSYRGKPYDHIGRFTDTWVMESGQWRCVASHASLLPKK